MADSVNQQIADALTARQLQTARVERDQRRAVWAILTALEAELLAALKASDPTEPTLLVWRRRRVAKLLEEIAPLIRASYAEIAALTTDALVRLARNETTTVATLVQEITQEETLPEPVPAPTLRLAVTQTLLPSVATATAMSAIGADWWRRLSTDVQQRISDQLRVSVSLEESLPEVVARVRGTAEKAFTDGIMGKARADAARLLRTEVTNAVSEARAALAEANSAQVRAIMHVSVLDGRTTIICQGRDGLLFTADTHDPIGHAIPYLSGVPYHWN